MGDDGASWAAEQREAGPALAAALASRALGCAGAFAATSGEGYGVLAARDVAAGEAFLFAHELDFTCREARAALSGAGGAAARHALAAVGSACDEDAAWRHAEASSPGADAGADARFALPCAEVLRLRHADAAGAASLGLAPLPAEQAAALGMRHGGCVAWTRRALAAGEEATRDGAPGKRTVSRAAALLALFEAPRWAHASERDALVAAVAAAAASPVPPATRPAHATQSPPLVDPQSPVCVYTDYALLADELRALSNSSAEVSFEVADEPAGIDVLWLNQPLRDFASLPAGLFVNQFPFEGCLVRKDLLPQTCRAAGSGDWPAWFPPCYDVATEAAQFLAAHAAAGGDGAATWVLKRAGGTHSADAAVTRLASCVARHVIARQLPGGDRVAQRHVDAPALLRGRKFDVRVYVAVRSFAPVLEARIDARYYGRVARAPWRDDAASLDDYATHFTVSWYQNNDDCAPDAASLPPLLGRAALEAAAAAEGWDWGAADAALRSALRELFAAAGATAVGPFPAGRALYGCDVIFAAPEAGQAGLQPRLLEVNFCGDLATLLQRVPGGAPGFVRDVFTYLFAGRADDAGMLQPL